MTINGVTIYPELKDTIQQVDAWIENKPESSESVECTMAGINIGLSAGSVAYILSAYRRGVARVLREAGITIEQVLEAEK